MNTPENRWYGARGDHDDLSHEDDESIKKTWEELVLIAQRVGGDFGMRVTLGESGKGSFFNPDDISITLDPLQVKEDPNLAKFVVAHEGGHRAVSVSPTQLGLAPRKIEELYSQVGFGYLQNAIEDPATNSWVEKRFPGLRPYVDEAYDKQFEENNAVLTTPEVTELAKRLGYWPKFSHYGSELIRYWHNEKFSESLDPAVEGVLKKTIKEATQSMGNIPDTVTYRERQVLRKAQERFRTNTEKIWPHVKELIEDDLKTTDERHLAANLFEQLESLDRMEKELQKALESNDKEKAEELERGVNELKEKINSSPLAQELMEELRNQIGEAIASIAKESTESEEKEGVGGASGFGPPVPMDKFSNELRKALNDWFEGLSEEQKKAIREESKKILSQFEDELNKRFNGKLNEEGQPSHKELSRKEQPKRSVPPAARVSSSPNDDQALQERLEKMRDVMMTPYEKERKEVVGLIDYLYLRLRRILKPEEYGGQETGFASGHVVDMSRAMQAEHDIHQKQKMWIRETAPESRDYRFWHTVDLSGSMDGEAIKSAFRGFIVASEALDRVEDMNNENVTVRQGITGFHNRVFEYKGYRERFTRDVEERLAGMVQRPKDRDAGTNTYYATSTALHNIESDLGKTANFLFTFTDGSPNYDVRESLGELLKNSKEERSKKKIKVGLIWVGSVADERVGQKELEKLVKEYGYDFGLLMPATGEVGGKNFAERLADLMEDVVENPNKY